MDDGHPPGPLSDDPRFLEGLQDLDEGLGPENPKPSGTANRRAPLAPGARAGGPEEAASIDSLDFLNDAVFDIDTTVAPAPAPPRPRPLLDIFPPAKVERRSVPAAKAQTGPSATPQTAPGPSAIVTVETPPVDAPLPPAAPPYAAFYDLAETPFGLSSDPRFFYPSASHAHALNAMLEAIHSAEGLIVLTAPEGFGKTTICRMAERDLDRRTLLALVVDPPQTIEELLQTVLVDFGVVSRAALARGPRLERDALASTLASFVKSLVTLKANAVIVIDEAHRVPAGVLTAAADVVGSLDSPRQLQLVLAGEPALAAIVKRAGLRAPAGRSGINVELRPIDDEEVAPYVRYRLRSADSRARVDFSPAAIGRIYLASRGIPREINRLCERALVEGANRKAGVIDGALIDRAAEELGLQPAAEEKRPAMRRTITAVVVLALMLAGAAAASWIFRDQATRAFQQWLEVPAARPAPAREMPDLIRPLPLPPPAPAPADNLPAPPRV